MQHQTKLLWRFAMRGNRRDIDQFVAFEDSFQDEAGRYLDALDRMSMLPGSELTSRLAPVNTPGALPTAEFDAAWGQGFMTPENFTRFSYQSLKK